MEASESESNIIEACNFVIIKAFAEAFIMEASIKEAFIMVAFIKELERKYYFRNTTCFYSVRNTNQAKTRI